MLSLNITGQIGKNVFERGGCPLQNASVEADDNLSFLRSHVQNSVIRWVKSISRIIESGKENGEFKKNINATEHATMIITLLEGGIMLGKIMDNKKHLFLALDRIVHIINTEIKK